MKKLFLSLSLVLVLAGCGVNNPQTPAGNGTTVVPTGNKVNMSNQGITSLAGNVFDRSGVTEFNVSGNRLTGALPSQIGKWKDLQVLNVSNNQMTGIPAEIGQLRFLTTIDYSNNQIDTMPNEIANLTNLVSLSLAGNLYREVPATLLQLPKLGTLNLSNNRLMKLPDNLAAWKNLQDLDLTGNPLSATEVTRARQALPTVKVNF